MHNRRQFFHLAVCGFSLFVFAGCALGKPRLHAVEIGTVPKPSRLIKSTSVWSKAKPVIINCYRYGMTGGASWPVELRAVHDGRAISILAVWNDQTESAERLSWVWEPKSRHYFQIETPTDLFAIKFCISGAEDACMMTGQEGIYDVWEWRAGWSHVTGYADDRVLKITRTRPETGIAQAYPLEQGDTKGFVYFQWEEDAGTLPYQLTPRPKEHHYPVQLGIAAQPPTESTGDILAEAVYQKTMAYNLEMYRLLETGNVDDYQLEGRGPHAMSIAITDGQEGANHFSSELFDLVID